MVTIPYPILVNAIIWPMIIVGRAYLLWKVARADVTRKWLFYMILAFAPITFFWKIGIFKAILLLNVPALSIILSSLAILGLIAGYYYGWGEILWEHAGQDRKAWYVLTILFSPLWIIWIIGKIKR